MSSGSRYNFIQRFVALVSRWRISISSRAESTTIGEVVESWMTMLVGIAFMRKIARLSTAPGTSATVMTSPPVASTYPLNAVSRSIMSVKIVSTTPIWPPGQKSGQTPGAVACSVHAPSASSKASRVSRTFTGRASPW